MKNLKIGWFVCLLGLFLLMICPVMGEVLIDDDFEKTKIGEVPVGWETRNKCQVVDTIAANGTRRSLELKTIESEDKLKYVTASRDFPVQTEGVLRVDYYIRTERTDAISLGLYVRGEGGKKGQAVAVAFWSDGRLKYNDGGVWKSAGPYQASKWYHIRYDIYLDFQTYDLYVNDMEKAIKKKINYRSKDAVSLSYLFTESSEAKVSTSYIDEIKVEIRADTFPPSSLIYHPYRILGCVKAVLSPQIDGKLDEEVWKEAPEVSFSPLIGSTLAEKTKAYLLWDKDNLYLGFLCSESQMEKLKANVKKRDGSVWQDDCVEIFIDTDHNHRNYYHLVANAIGTRYDLKKESGVRRNWDAKWKAKAIQEENYWTVEVAIPFKDLGVSPEAGDVWGFNLNRERQPKETEQKVELSGWCPNESFHCPEKFGHLVFIDDDLLKQDRSQIVRKIASSIGSLQERSTKIEIQLKQIASIIEKIKGSPIEGKYRNIKKQFKIWSDIFNSPSKEITFAWWINQEKEFIQLEEKVGQLSVEAMRIPLLGKAFKGKGYAVCLESSMKKVFKEGYVGEVASEVQISLARNEYEGFQLAVISASDNKKMENVTVEISDLVNRESGNKINKENIDWKVVDYIKTVPPYYKVDYVGWWPDVLLEKNYFDIKADEIQPLWITVYAPAESIPGEYEGSVIIKPTGLSPTKIKLKVKVWNFSLPKTCRLKTVFCFQEDHMEGYYKSKISQKVRRRFYKFLLEHRINPITLWGGDISPRKEDLAFCVNNGLNMIPLKIWGSPTSKNKKETYEDSLKERVDFLRGKGWLNMAFAFGFDEVLNRPKDIPRMKKMFDLTKKTAPEVPRLCTVRIVPGLEGYLDIWCPLIFQYNYDDALMRKALGEEIWWYLTDLPAKPYSNLNIDSPGIDPRILPWMNWKYGVKGILYWSINREWLTNSEELKLLTDAEIEKGQLDWIEVARKENQNKKWPEVPWIPYFRHLFNRRIKWANGAGNLIYPGPDQVPISSIRLENLRDGIEDYEYLYILKTMTERLKALKIKKHEGIVEDSEVVLRVNPEVVESIINYTKNPDVLLSEREKVASLIEKITDILQNN